MYILQPVIHETIWGGHKLGYLVQNEEAKIGHLYMVNGHLGMSNLILNGNYQNCYLNDVFLKERKSWKLDEYEEFPLTIALVDAAENLSIQVHPDDTIAELLESKKKGKTESWVFIDAPEKGWIYAGCMCKTKQELHKFVAMDKIDEITGHINIRSNDYVCINAGTLHAMTTGSLVYEIEYGSDFTYRFYDYHRKDPQGCERELHVQKALRAIKEDMNQDVLHMADHRWIQEADYEICRETNVTDYKNTSDILECFSVIKGVGKCDENHVSAGMSILLLPQEELRDVNFDEVIVARIRK